jgi:hypothetical protein
MRNHHTTPSHPVSRCVGVLAIAMVVTLAAAPSARAQSSGVLFASITDPAGEPVTSLNPQDFQITEDGVAMRIVSAAPGTEPMKIAVLIDNGEGIGNGVSALRNGMTEFLNILPPQHEVAIYSVAGNVLEMVDFTTDRDELLDAADGLFNRGGSAKIVEGLTETWERRFDGDEAWPVIFMVITDGPEGSGNINPDRFNEFVQDVAGKGAMVHTVILENRLGSVQSQISRIVTQATGGLHRSINSATALVDVLTEFATRMGEHFDAMASRYRVEYERPGDTPGAQVGAKIVGPNYTMQLFSDRRVPPQ